jgi:hypothetical protein
LEFPFMPPVSRIIAFLIGLPLLGACADGESQVGFRQKMDRWVGMPAEAVALNFGRPVWEGRSPDGRRTVQYDLSWTESGGGYSLPVMDSKIVRRTYRNENGNRRSYFDFVPVRSERYVAPYSRQRRCLTTFYFTDAGRVATYAHVGDGCVAPEQS